MLLKLVVITSDTKQTLLIYAYALTEISFVA